MNTNCIFCNEPLKTKLFCSKHSNLFIKQLSFVKDKNLSDVSIKNYYHNLRHSIMKSGSIDTIIELSSRLIALSYVYYKNTKNMTLFNKSIIEVKNIYSNKLAFQTEVFENVENIRKYSLNDYDIREKWPTNFVASDGHKVRSLGELFIDNWLHSHNFKHSYEKKVFYEENKFFISDFFLDNEQIYLEYCGKVDKVYLAKKKAQKLIYESLNLKIIYVDYEDLKMFDDFFEEKLRKLL